MKKEKEKDHEKIFVVFLATLLLASCATETAVNESDSTSVTPSEGASSVQGSASDEESVPDAESSPQEDSKEDEIQQPDPDTGDVLFANPDYAIHRAVDNLRTQIGVTDEMAYNLYLVELPAGLPVNRYNHETIRIQEDLKNLG